MAVVQDRCANTVSVNPLRRTYLGRWAVRSLNRWALCAFVALNPWVLLLECEAVEMAIRELGDGGE